MLRAEQTLFEGHVTTTTLTVLAELLASMPPDESNVAADHGVSGEQRKQATLLFASAKGLTRLSGTSRQTRRLDAIGNLWQRLDAIIRAHGGTVDKHMGDVVMGIFGAPAAAENDPERAVRCALAMQAAFSDFLSNLYAGEGSDTPAQMALDLKIGINTGMVSLGRVGSDRDLTAIGDAVNVASRLIEVVPGSGVLIAKDTYRLVRDLYRVEPLGSFAMKGRRGPVEVYRVIGVNERPIAGEPYEQVTADSHLVGTDEEVALLQQAQDASQPTEQSHRLGVSPSLRGVLQARLDHLPEGERLTLQRAAVVGTTFWDGAIRAMNRTGHRPLSDERIQATLAALEQRNVIVETSRSAFPGSRAFQFRQEAMQQVTYDSVLLRERPAYHRQIAHWMEAESGDLVPGHAREIAHHYRLGGDVANAARLYASAAERSSEQFDVDEAIELFRRALDLLEERPQFLDRRQDILGRLGRLYFRQGRLVEALAAYTDMSATAEASGDLHGAATAANGIAVTRIETAEFESASRAAQEAAQAARLAGAEEELIQALLLRAGADRYLGRLDEANEAAQEGLRRSRALGNLPMEAQALALLMQLARQKANVTGAADAFEDLKAMVRVPDKESGSGELKPIYLDLGKVALESDDYPAAQHYLKHALEIPDRPGTLPERVEALRLLGLAHTRAGQASEGLACLTQAVDLAESLGERYQALWCRLGLAEALLADERLEAAEVTVRRVISAAQDPQRMGRWLGLGEAEGLLRRVIARRA